MSHHQNEEDLPLDLSLDAGGRAQDAVDNKERDRESGTSHVQRRGKFFSLEKAEDRPHTCPSGMR